MTSPSSSRKLGPVPRPERTHSWLAARAAAFAVIAAVLYPLMGAVAGWVQGAFISAGAFLFGLVGLLVADRSGGWLADALTQWPTRRRFGPETYEGPVVIAGSGAGATLGAAQRARAIDWEAMLEELAGELNGVLPSDCRVRADGGHKLDIIGSAANLHVLVDEETRPPPDEAAALIKRVIVKLLDEVRNFVATHSVEAWPPVQVLAQPRVHFSESSVFVWYERDGRPAAVLAEMPLCWRHPLS